MAVLDAVIEQHARQALKLLSRYVHIKAAYVFGSQAEGTAGKLSDIDIGVFIENIGDWDLRSRVRIAALVQKEIGNDVEIHLFPAEALSHAEPASFAAYIQRHGVLITHENHRA